MTDHLLELRDSVRRFLTARAPLSAVRAAMAAQRYDADVWSTMGGQLGLTALPFAEEVGGAGASWAELAVVSEELGRALLPSAFLASVVLAGGALATSGDAVAAKELLPPIAAGETTAALAVLDDGGRWSGLDGGVVATRSADGYRIDGRKTYVLDGHTADLVVVTASTAGGPALFVVAGDAPGLLRVPLPTLDETRPQARLDFSAVPARLIGREGEAGDVVAATFDRALVAVAADALGGAQRCLEMAVAYAKERMAFGRPIGSFQAIKHKLVDLLLEVEFARVAVEHAAAAAAAGADDLTELASLAAGHTLSTYAVVATENIHVHGGIGFTWEHDAHLFFKRAKSSQLLFGDAAFHRERVATSLLGPASWTENTGGSL